MLICRYIFKTWSLCNACKQAHYICPDMQKPLVSRYQWVSGMYNFPGETLFAFFPPPFSPQMKNSGHDFESSNFAENWWCDGAGIGTGFFQYSQGFFVTSLKFCRFSSLKPTKCYAIHHVTSILYHEYEMLIFKKTYETIFLMYSKSWL